MAEFDGTQRKAFERARESWPQVSLSYDAFVEYAHARAIPRERVLSRASDIYLAAACSLNKAGAIDALEVTVIRSARASVCRYGSGDFVDEVLQRLRVHLLVAGDDSESRISRFDGRASLRSWVNVCAVRMALYTLRGNKNRRESTMDWESAWMSATTFDGPLADTKARYSDAFQDALKTASAALTPRQRTLLKVRFAHGMSVDEIAAMFAVHRVTAWRWLQGAQESLLEAAVSHLRVAIPADDVGLQSLLSLVRSHIELSLSGLFEAPMAAEGSAPQSSA